MDNHVIVKEWFSLGKKDIESAKFLRKMKPVPFEIICYHCQQSAFIIYVFFQKRILINSII